MKPCPIFIKRGTYISRIRSREGPAIVFVCMYKDSCVILKQKKEIIKFCQLNKGTQTREEFDIWWTDYCEEVVNQSNLDMEAIKKQGFGPEAHEDEEEENDNTKLDTSLKKASQSKAKAKIDTTAQGSSSESEEEDPTKTTKMIM